MCIRVFTSSLRQHSTKKINTILPSKPGQFCTNCSRKLSTTSSLHSIQVNKSHATLNTRHDAITPLSVSTLQKSLSSSLTKTSASVSATSATSATSAHSSQTSATTPPPANATAAFQDLLGLNNTPNSDLKNTFYQRELPSNLVQFSSSEGKAFFRSSMEANHAEGFFPLTGNFTTQSEPAYCGPSSLAMVLNALAVDPKQTWKSPWRWYSDELLECCSSKEQMKKNGITFDKFACLAKCHSNVIAKRAPTFTFEEFQQDVIDVTARSDKFLVVSFSRKTLGQTGDGHFSPIGAYNPENKMVLVLDTARYKYPSYWCPIETLYESMTPIDKETGRARGYFLICYDVEHPPVKLCSTPPPPSPSSSSPTATLQSSPTSTSSPSQPSAAVALDSAPIPSTQLNWSTIAQSFCKRIPENMWLEKPRSLEHAIQVVLRNVPVEFTRVLANQSMASSKAYSAHHQREHDEEATTYIQHLLHDITKSPLYPIVFRTLYPDQPLPASTSTDLSHQQDKVDQQTAFATLFILGSPSMLYTSLPRDVQVTLAGYRQGDYMTDVVKREVDRISHEVKELTKSFCTCGPGFINSGTSPSSCG